MLGFFSEQALAFRRCVIVGLVILRLRLVQRDVDAGLLLRQPGRAGGNALPRFLLRLLFLLFLRLLIWRQLDAAEGVDDGGRGQPQRAHQAGHEAQHKDRQRGHLPQHGVEADGQSSGEHAAGFQRDAGGPQRLQQSLRLRQALHGADVDDGPRHHRQDQRANQVGGHAAAPVEQQNPRPQQQRGRDDVPAPAGKAAAKQVQPLDQKRLVLKVGNDVEQGQDQQDASADAPADRRFFRLCLPLSPAGG